MFEGNTKLHRHVHLTHPAIPRVDLISAKDGSKHRKSVTAMEAPQAETNKQSKPKPKNQVRPEPKGANAPQAEKKKQTKPKPESQVRPEPKAKVGARVQSWKVKPRHQPQAKQRGRPKKTDINPQSSDQVKPKANSQVKPPQNISANPDDQQVNKRNRSKQQPITSPKVKRAKTNKNTDTVVHKGNKSPTVTTSKITKKTSPQKKVSKNIVGPGASSRLAAHTVFQVDSDSN